MKQLIRNKRVYISSNNLYRHFISLVLYLSIGAILVLVVSCSSPANEQVTVERMTAMAADRMAAATKEVEEATSTARALKKATSTSIAATEEAEADLAAQATAEAESTVNAEATSKAEVQATTNAEATAEAEATLTAEAEAQATADFEATIIAFEEEKMTLIDEVRAETPIVSSQEGSLTHATDSQQEFSPADVNLRNFAVVIHFSFDFDETALETGDFAVKFRSLADASTYLHIAHDGHWQLLSEVDESRETIHEGDVEILIEDDWNELILYAEDEQGFFFVNGHYVSEIDLASSADRGEIAVSTGLLSDVEVAGSTAEFKDFAIWSLDPIPPTPTPAPQPTAIPQPTNPPQPTSPPAPPPPSGGNGRIVVVNETEDLDMEVYLRNCCENWAFPAPAGEVTVKEFPIDEYAWGVQGHGCFRDLPQLFLKDYDDTVLLVVASEGGCPWALQLYMPE